MTRKNKNRFVRDEKIKIIRKTANSKEECERLKAELEAQGFTVMVKELVDPHAGGEYYVASLFAEKRKKVLIDTRAVEEERKKLKKRGLIVDITMKVGFWTIVILALLGILFLWGPFLRACRALF